VTPAFFVAYSNLYFDVWLEQGLLAFVTILVMLGSSFWLLFKRSAFRAKKQNEGNISTTGEIVETRRKRKKRKKLLPQEMVLFQWAAFVSLVVMVFHGLIDDALYGDQASPFLFFAPAMVVLITRRRESAAEVGAAIRWRRWAVFSGATAVLLIGLFWVFRPKIQAQWYANLGALELARVELVRWPTNQWDVGNNLVRFDTAEALFEQALQMDAQNRTANQRLGMIAMIKHDYETAVTHLEQAEGVAAAHRGVAKSLGYSYVWQGQFDEAVDTLVLISESRAEMAVYSNWWQRQNRADLAAKANEMVAILEKATILMP
jgi:tetratricopeptide (TPR) repeat protein